MTSRRAFGDTLRRHREQRGIAIERISELTKISAALLAALERGDCSRWPGGIYSRAYIRDYAQAVGLDRDETVARFTECFAETAFPDGAPKEAAPPVAPPATPLRLTLGDGRDERRRVLARRAAVVAFDLLLTFLVSTVFTVAAGADFWMALAGVSMCGHAVKVLLGGGHTWDAVVHAAARRPLRPAEPPVTEPSALAEAV